MTRPLGKRLGTILAMVPLLLAAGCPAPVATKMAAPPVAPRSGPERRADVKDLSVGETLEVPYILWGGDVATYLANGGETTQPGSLFARHGLKLKLVRGDDFAEQVKNYKEGKTPFLRGTLSMLGQASEEIGDPRSQPVVFLQLTWSAGDHLVSREGLKTLGDLKGKKVALQKGGPHVGMFNDILRTAQFTWQDVNVVWTEAVTGDQGPAEAFRKDPSLDACFAITPDMLALTGGPEAVGDGDKGTVKGAHVLVSTAQMLRSIADVYACRKDYFEQHRDRIERFAAGYLKACEELVAVKKAPKEQPYKDVLAKTRQMFGNDVRNDDEADGLISDAVFVGLPGNYSFFKDKGNLSGFDAKAKAAVDLALSLGDARNRVDLLQADMDYAQVKKVGGLTAKVEAPRTGRFAADAKEKGVIYSFFVYFGGGQDHFPEDQYGQHFQRAAEQASLFGNAMISIRGHANASDLMFGFRDTVLKRGIVTQRGSKYFLQDGSEFAMNDMKAIVGLIEKEKLGGVSIPVVGDRQPMTMNALIDLLQGLSDRRSAAVRNAVVGYANRHGYRMDESQMRSVGVGGLEPVVMFPPNDTEGQKNRRVEFRIIAVGNEAIATEDFDF